MKDRVVQRVNPYVVRKSCALACLAAVPILWMEFSLVTVLFSVMVFMMILASECMFTWYAFRRVVIDENGIRCGKAFIEWRNVKTVRVFRAYAGFPNRWENAEKEINAKHFEYPIGVMIGINAYASENIMDFRYGIYISRTAKADCMLKKYCRLYREYTEEHTQSKISDFQKGEKNQYFWGNPRLFAKLLGIGFLFSFAVVFCWTVILFQLLLWKAVTIGILLCFLLVNVIAEIYRDAFLLIKVNEHGIFFDGMMIPWDQVSDVRKADVKLSMGFYHMDCGTVIAVNTEVGDRYLGRHVYDGVYFYKTKKAEKLFSKYLKDES